MPPEMTGAQQNGEQPILNVEGDLVALGPLRRDLLPLYTRWINDLAAVRTLGAFLPMTLEGETKWYDEWATSEKTVPFTVYARPELRPAGTASLFEVDHRNRTAVFGIFIGDGEYRGEGAENVVRSALSKVAWVGKTTSMVFGLALVLALVIGVASTAMSATGGNFILGKANGATTGGKLTASIAGPALTLVNNSTGAAATALNISVASGKPPLKVNAAAGKATNLNADKLDGRDSSTFFTGRQVVENTVTARPNGVDYYDSTHVVAACPSGKFALGGGYHQGTVAQDMVIAFSKPTSDGTGWELWVHNTAAHNRTVTAYAICAAASS